MGECVCARSVVCVVVEVSGYVGGCMSVGACVSV